MHFYTEKRDPLFFGPSLGTNAKFSPRQAWYAKPLLGYEVPKYFILWGLSKQTTIGLPISRPFSTFYHEPFLLDCSTIALTITILRTETFLTRCPPEPRGPRGPREPYHTNRPSRTSMRAPRRRRARHQQTLKSRPRQPTMRSALR